MKADASAFISEREPDEAHPHWGIGLILLSLASWAVTLGAARIVAALV